MAATTNTSARGSSSTEPPRVVLLASPGAGHIIPLAELARRLATEHGFAVTIVRPTGLFDPAIDAAVLSSLPPSVATAPLPAAALDDIPPDIGFGVLMFELARRSLPHLRDVMVGGSAPAAALVCDFFGTAALELAAELGVPGYVFLPNSLSMIGIMRRLVELHADAGPGEYRDLPDPLPIPGGPVLRHGEIPDGFQDRTDPNYAYVVEEARRYGGADGFLVNSFEEMETAMAESFRRDAEDGVFPPVFPVGPFVRSSISGGEEADESACLEWLDRQPAGSVVFVSFGTGGALSMEQTAEIAAGLEASGHRFLWVVRMPSVDGISYAPVTVRGKDDDPLAWLPDGFVERTRGRGLAVAAWVPQVRVLNHPATAAFVSHCGWNSTLESVSAGVPIVAWPLYAEQKMNAVILAEVTGVALRPVPRDGGGFVTREQVAAAVREIMDGEKGRAVRARARELQKAAARAWSSEGSRRALGEVAAKWKASLVNNNGSGA